MIATLYDNTDRTSTNCSYSESNTSWTRTQTVYANDTSFQDTDPEIFEDFEWERQFQRDLLKMHNNRHIVAIRDCKKHLFRANNKRMDANSGLFWKCED